MSAAAIGRTPLLGPNISLGRRSLTPGVRHGFLARQDWRCALCLAPGLSARHRSDARLSRARLAETIDRRDRWSGKPGSIKMPYRYHRPRTVIITGASAGVGRAIAQRFARAGDRIGLIARDDSALQDVQRGLQAVGGEAAWEAADVANAKAIFAAAERLEQRLGKVDIWINDAMETVFSTVADMDPDEFRRVTEVCYHGFVHGTMAALNSMRPRRR